MEKSKVIRFVIIALIGIISIIILSLVIAILVKVYQKDDDNSQNTSTTLIISNTSPGGSGNSVTVQPVTSSDSTVTSAVTNSIGISSTTEISSSPKCPNPQKSDLPLASLPGAYDTLSWGTYRAPLYFGLRMRHPDSPLFGLMWFRQTTTSHNLVLKHYCEDDGVRCMWSDADGETFGSQPIVDTKDSKATLFSTDWIRVNRSWEAQISVETNETVAFIFYFAYQDTVSNLNATYSTTNTLSSINGSFGPLGYFQLSFESSGKIVNDASLVINIEPMLDAGIVNELILSSFLPCKDASSNICIDNGGRPPDGNPNFAAIQFTVNGTATLKTTFKPNDDPAPLPQDFMTALQTKITDFRSIFTKTFNLQNVNANFVEMGRYGFANMVGSVSYWTGYCQVASPCLPYNEAINYGPLTLYSGIPSRPYYPRGFLWDEGFHNILMRKFRPELSLDIVASWLDMIDSEGWIPREVVLDSEAHKRAPPLLFEDSTVANPPMFIYLVGKLMEDSNILSTYKDRLIKLFPRMKLLYTWLKDIQKGPKEGSCQWQGRNGTTDLELNPGTTPSGLDDYPRASHPTNQEYHVDMRCWMALSSTVMLKLATLANATDWIPIIQADQALFNNLTNLDALHWSDAAQGYFDYGLHSYEVAIVGKKQPDGTVKYRREVFSKPEYRFVDDVYGYVNIFPFLLKLLPADSSKLQIILSRLNDTQEMWTPFGLRSVSKRSRYYDAYNTDTAAPYWRGPIWINMNYLALEALQYYSTIDGPIKSLAKNLYDSLKFNVVKNLANQYDSTGFIWEHYDDKTGAGAGTRPFTGWSALVLAIMGDAYN